jgi:hypothetical protein
MRKVRSKPLAAVAACGMLVLLSCPADAGPPLICHPLQAGSAALLPWGTGGGWNTPDRRYDARNLMNDTLTLLSSDASLLARMENLRRATIYAADRPKTAAALLEALLARIPAGAHAPSPDAALAWFDAGYLIEAYRQMAMIDHHDLLAIVSMPSSVRAEVDDLDGYRMLGKARELGGADAEIEFAQSMMTLDAAAAAEHRRQASARAPSGSLLARNLAAYSY